MYRLLLLLLCMLPFITIGQFEDPYQKAHELYLQGRIDSIEAPILFYRNDFHAIDSARSFYIYTDTVKEVDGKYSIGKKIVDVFYDFDKCRIGHWISYYSDGHKFSEGSYSLVAVTICQAGGPMAGGYYIKSGYWQYWYPNGQKMAAGVFYNDKERYYNGTCYSDTVAWPIPTADWDCYTEQGKPVPLSDRVKAVVCGE